MVKLSLPNKGISTIEATEAAASVINSASYTLSTVTVLRACLVCLLTKYTRTFTIAQGIALISKRARQMSLSEMMSYIFMI